MLRLPQRTLEGRSKFHSHGSDKTVVIPVGCNAPTVIGGGFDLQEVSLGILHMAFGLLSDGDYDPGAGP